jgi:hypothetical protein
LVVGSVVLALLLVYQVNPFNVLLYRFPIASALVLLLPALMLVLAARQPGQALLFWMMLGQYGLIVLLWLYYDRYALVLVPLAIAALLAARPKLCAGVAVVLLAGFGTISLVGMRDHLAYNAALWQAVADLRRQGVRDADINGGYMVNGWLQYAHPENAHLDQYGRKRIPWFNTDDIELRYQISNQKRVDRFKLTDESLISMCDAGVPDADLTKLEPMKQNPFLPKEEFINEITESTRATRPIAQAIVSQAIVPPGVGTPGWPQGLVAITLATPDAFDLTATLCEDELSRLVEVVFKFATKEHWEVVESVPYHCWLARSGKIYVLVRELEPMP